MRKSLRPLRRSVVPELKLESRRRVARAMRKRIRVVKLRQQLYVILTNITESVGDVVPGRESKTVYKYCTSPPRGGCGQLYRGCGTTRLCYGYTSAYYLSSVQRRCPLSAVPSRPRRHSFTVSQ